MPHDLELAHWNRRKLFDFFRGYDSPFFNICTDVDISAFQPFVKRGGLSFFAATLFLSIRAANEIASFRYRLRGERVIVHDVVHAGSTVLNADETFNFCYFDYTPDFSAFARHVATVLTRNAQTPDLNPHDERDDLIHYSVLPWIRFTSITHARKFKTEDSIPKIVFGKYEAQNGQLRLPISIEAHHALMDGLHVAKYLNLFQKYLQNPAESLTIGDESERTAFPIK